MGWATASWPKKASSLGWGALLLLVGTTPVLAVEGPAEWAELFDARLLDVAENDAETAAFNLQSLLNRLEPADPLHGQVAYWLAHAYVTLDQRQLAHEALDLAMESESSREAALALHKQLESIDRTITSLPVSAPLDDDFGPFVHSWHFGDRGWLERGTPEGGSDPALRWACIVQDRQDDQISAAFAPEAGRVKGIALELKAEHFPAHLRILLVDERGREFATDPLTVPTDRWLDLELDRSSFHSTDPTTPGARPSSRITALHIHDVTTYLSADRGPRVVWLDDLEIW
jgi:hypothetical protein